MQIRAGYQITYECPKPTPMLLMLSVHPSRAGDLVSPAAMTFDPPLPVRHYRDLYGNVCSRIVAPAGMITFASDFLIDDSGTPDIIEPDAGQLPVEALPDDVLVYLLGSRYCDTDQLAGLAWALFGSGPTGWARVQAICDYVHDHIAFGYQHASVHAHRLGRLPRAARRVPRFRPPGDHALPLHEHPRALLHRLPGRHRRAALARGRWISAPGSRPTSAAAGTPSTPATTCPASAAS